MFSPLYASENLQSTLIGGRYVKQGEFPEVVYISNGRAKCTASLIGSRALLTAAHCTSEDGEVHPVSQEKEAYQFIHKQIIYRATCTISDKYASEDHDVALCLVNRDVDVKLASVVGLGEGPALQDVVTHVGYGCVRPGGGGGNDGRLKTGEAVVTELSSGAGRHWWWSEGDGLCYGDSGGPGYKRLKDPKNEHHWVMGVNSRGDIRSVNLLTDLSSKASQEFMKKWARDNNAEICGLNKLCYREDPHDDCRVEKELVKYYGERLSYWQAQLNQCESSQQSLSVLPFSN